MYWLIGFYSALLMTVVMTVIVLFLWKEIIAEINTQVWLKTDSHYDSYNYDYRAWFWVIVFIGIPWIIFFLAWVLGYAFIIGGIIYYFLRNNEKLKKIIDILQEKKENTESQ